MGGQGAGAQVLLLGQHATSADRRRKGQQGGAKAGWGSEMYQGAAPGIRGREGRGTNSVWPHKPLWQDAARSHRTDGGGGRRGDREGPGSYSQRPEVGAASASRKNLIARSLQQRKRSPGTPDVSCLSWPPWKGPPLGARAHHHQHPEPQLAPENTLSPSTVASTALTGNLLCPASPSGTESASLPRDAAGHGGRGRACAHMAGRLGLNRVRGGWAATHWGGREREAGGDGGEGQQTGTERAGGTGGTCAVR